MLRGALARALTAGHAQVDFMLIRLVADLVVNYFTTRFFLHDKTVNLHKYEEHNRRPDHGGDSGDEERELEFLDDVVVSGPLALLPKGLRDSLVPRPDESPL